jgi:putative ABC transport system permease protein
MIRRINNMMCHYVITRTFVDKDENIHTNNYLYYNRKLIDYIIDKNKDSKIVLEQLKSDYNVLGMNVSKNNILSYLGYNTLPSGIDIYVSDLDNKKMLLNKLDEYNKKNDKLIYVDNMNDAIDIIKSIINIITIVLVIFSFISIIVSSLMIFILTNNRIMERTKEIGILRGIGARNKDICRLFNFENIIIGIISSFIGIIVIMLLVEPINMMISVLMDDSDLFKVYFDLGIIGVIFNIIMVVLSGYIPVKIASKKKIVDCINGC